MNSWKRYIPDGARDIIFEDCSRRIDIINSLRRLYINSGFLEVSSPMLEFYDVFCGENAGIEQEKTYKLFDSAGRILVLRPDLTLPIARIAATKLKDICCPMRICYSGNIFRANETWDGKNNEITQSGAEIIGTSSLKADFDVIVTAIEALKTAGVKNFEIELGQAEFFKAIVEDTYLDAEDMERLRSIVENKNFTALKDFIYSREEVIGKDNAKVLENLTELYGGREILDKARELTSNQLAHRALDNIENILEKIESIGYGRYISIDLGMVQHIHYYTGLIFKGYSGKVGSEILSGGRYDSLIARFGKDMPAVGFAINIDGVMQALEKQEGFSKLRKDKYLIHSGGFIKAVWNISSQIRNRGYIAEFAVYEDEGDLLNYAEKKGFTKIVSVIGENALRIKDINMGCTVTYNIENFMSTLRD